MFDRLGGDVLPLAGRAMPPIETVKLRRLADFMGLGVLRRSLVVPETRLGLLSSLPHLLDRVVASFWFAGCPLTDIHGIAHILDCS